MNVHTRIVKTNGIGKPCTTHLDLGVSLKAQWDREFAELTARAKPKDRAAIIRHAEEVRQTECPIGGSGYL